MTRNNTRLVDVEFNAAQEYSRVPMSVTVRS